MDDIVSLNQDDENDSDNIEKLPGENDSRPIDNFSLSKSIKLSILSAVLLLIMMTDVFVERVLEPMNPTFVYNRGPTRKGLVVISMMLAMGMIVLDFLIRIDKI